MISPKASVRKMSVYNPPLEKRKGMMRLDFNENTLGCSPKVIKALRSVTSEDVCCYPEYESFKKKLSSFLGVCNSEIILTNGADEAIKVVIDTFIEKGDEIVIPVPCFSMFTVYLSIAGANIKEVIYNKDLSFPVKNVLNSISTDTRMVILTNPNNPTGTVISKTEMISILKKAQDSVVVIDEAYVQFFGESSKELVKEFKNLVVIQTFSKAFGLAGLRLGCIVSSKEMVENLEKVISPYSVNALAIIAGVAALNDKQFVRRYVSEVSDSKKTLEYELKKLGIRTYPTRANFIIAYFGNMCNYVYSELRACKILVRNRSEYPLLNNCLRIGIGSKEQTLILIDELKRILRQKTLLFDMDGVLVDVSRSYRLAIKYTAEYFTKEKIQNTEIQKVKESCGYNNDWDVTEVLILKRKVIIPKEDIVEKFQEFYLGRNGKGLIDNERWLLPKNLLKKLYAKYQLGIVTGRPRKEAFLALEKACTSEYFDMIVTMEDVPQGEDDLDTCGLRKAMSSIRGKSAVYFGDCIDDMAAAKKSNIDGIGVIPKGTNSSRIAALLRKNGAREVISCISKIEEVLL